MCVGGTGRGNMCAIFKTFQLPFGLQITRYRWVLIISPDPEGFCKLAYAGREPFASIFFYKPSTILENYIKAPGRSLILNKLPY